MVSRVSVTSLPRDDELFYVVHALRSYNLASFLRRNRTLCPSPFSRVSRCHSNQDTRIRTVSTGWSNMIGNAGTMANPTL